MMERRLQLEKKRHQGKTFIALIFFPMVALLSGSSRTMTGLSSSTLLPPPERATPVRHRPIVIYERNLQQINRFEKEELAVGRNGSVVRSKNRVDNTADVVTSDVDTGDKAAHVKNIPKPMASHFPGSATTPPQGKPDFVFDELFETRLATCGISDAFRNREYHVGEEEAFKFAHVLMSGSMDSSHLNKSRHIAGILPRLIAQNVTYAILPHADHFEFIPLEEVNSESSASVHYSVSEPVGLTEVVLTTFAVAIIAWWIVITMNIKPLISGCFGKNVYIFVVIAFVLAASSHVQSALNEDIPPVEALVLDERGEAYEPFFNEMHSLLEANTEPGEYGQYFLPSQKQGPPAWWISVEVKGDDIGRCALMYFRSDVIYLLGFMNGYGTLYCTDDAAKMFTQGCTPLGFKSSYHDLTGRVDKSIDLSKFMQAVLLGRTAARYAAQILVEYGVTINQPELAKRAMLAYSIMIAEALRFKTIGSQVKQCWLYECTLTEEQANTIFTWQDESILLCRKNDRTDRTPPRWSRGEDRLTKAGIYRLQDIINTLDFVKGEKHCTPLRKEKKRIA